MSFLVLMLVLVIEKCTDWRQRVQKDGAWSGLLARTQAAASTRPAWWTLALCVALPVAAAGIVFWLIEHLLYAWIAFLLGLGLELLLVLYSLGRGDIVCALGPFRDAWRRGDLEAAQNALVRDLGVTVEAPESALRQAQGALLWQSYQGFFAVIFWYVLLGPVVALAYRLFDLVERNSTQESVRLLAGQWRTGMDWLPVRALALSFALMGNFMRVACLLLSELLRWQTSAQELLLEIGMAGADLDTVEPGESGVASLDTLRQLLVRAAVLWYATLALIILLW